MPATRREVLRSGATIAALASTGVFRASLGNAENASFVRLPLEEFAKNDKLVSSLRRGVAAMKARPPSDPRSWFFQGSVHAVLNNEIVKAAQRDPGMANVDVDRFWNKCPHFGENAGNFLLWHRAYLYYFERILRDAAQDADLCVPYWNYIDSNGVGTADSKRLLPKIFASKLVGDPGTASNPLFHEFRDTNVSSNLSELSGLAVDTNAAFDSKEFFGAIESNGFAGGVVEGEGDANTSGLIERRPHNLVHLFVGNVSASSGAQGMASVSEAAFDPIFWPHHANIDRLWVEFVGKDGKSWGALPNKDWFNNRPWSFYDYDMQVKTEPRNYWMDHRKLGYTYFAEPSPKLLWPSATVLTSAAASPFAFRASSELFRSSEKIVLNTSSPTTIDVAGDPARAILGIASRATVATSLTGGTERRVVLQLLRPVIDTIPAAGFEVFVNASSDDKSPQLVGVIAPFGWKEHQHHNQSGNMGPQFDVTEVLAMTAMGRNSIKIDIHPFAVASAVGEGSSVDTKNNVDRGSIVFDGARIFVAERPSNPNRQ